MGPLMDIRCFIGTVFSVLRSDGVVEGGTGAKKKLMVITNHSYMLWQFRRELIGKLMEDYDVIISTPFVGHEDDFAAMGCTMIETDVDRRGSTRDGYEAVSDLPPVIKRTSPGYGSYLFDQA